MSQGTHSRHFDDCGADRTVSSPDIPRPAGRLPAAEALPAVGTVEPVVGKCTDILLAACMQPGLATTLPGSSSVRAASQVIMRRLHGIRVGPNLQWRGFRAFTGNPPTFFS